MDKKTYDSPEISVAHLSIEGGIAISNYGKAWYEVGGQGNFDYNLIEDDMWE